MEKRIFLSSPTMHDEEMGFIQEAFDRNWVAPLGFNCDGFEAEMIEYLKSADEDCYAVALSSGTAAIHLAVMLAGVKPGDKVVVGNFVGSDIKLDGVDYKFVKQDDILAVVTD